jgi:mRNA-degrading endonuclease RelE of RelBE toxin-antitoxin system
MNLTFVENHIFTARWHARQTDDALRALQNDLLNNPSLGKSIPGCPMLRKLRWGDESRQKGKRGGVRVIYTHTPEAHRIDLIAVYGKDERDDLTREQIKQLCELARLLRDEAKRSIKRSVKGKNQ